MGDLTLPQAFGIALRTRREVLGISQEAFASRAGVHRTYVGSVERGERNLPLENIAAFARALGIPASVLIGEAERLLGASED